MVEEIGVLLDKSKQITSFDRIDQINIFHKVDNEWKLKEELKEIQIDGGSVSLIQKSIIELIDQLKECKILLGTIITGIPFHILDRKGITLCEAEEYSSYIFEEIIKDQLELDNKEQTSEKEEYLGPTLVEEDGVYFLDFIKLQVSHPEISSKKAIIPFLDNVIFYELQVICDHVMPWLEYELNSRGLRYETEPYGKTKIKIIISHCKCSE